MTRYELLQILKSDGTYEEMLQAINEHELTEQEHDNILAFLQAENKEAAEEAFRRVLEDIDKAPIYTNTDEKKHWKDYRKELADEIYDMNIKLSDLREEINGYDTSIKELENTVDLDPEFQVGFDRFNELKNEAFVELERDTIKISALTLMDAEAKSEEQQFIARQRQEMLEPIKEGLKETMKDLGEDLKDFGVALRDAIDRTHQTNKVIDRAILASEHHILSWVQKSYMREASREHKKLDKARSHNVHQRSKAIKEANKILKQEYIREQNFSKIRSLAGKDVSVKPLETVNNFDRAMEILNAHPTKRTQTKAKLIQWGINRYEKSEAKHKKRMEQALFNTKHIIDRRRQEIKGISIDAAQLEEDSRFSHNIKSTDRLAKWLANAAGRTQFSRNDMSDKMYDYLMSNGMSDLVQGNPVDWNKYDAKTKVSPKVQEVVQEPVKEEVSINKEQVLSISHFPTICEGKRTESFARDKEGNVLHKISGQGELDKYKTFNTFLKAALATDEAKEQFKLNVLQRDSQGVLHLDEEGSRGFHWKMPAVFEMNGDTYLFEDLSQKAKEQIIDKWLEGENTIEIKGKDLLKNDVLSNELLRNYEYALDEKVVIYDCKEEETAIKNGAIAFQSYVLSGKIHDPKSNENMTFQYDDWNETVKIFSADGKEISAEDNKRLYEMVSALAFEREGNTNITITEINKEFKECHGTLTINGVEFNFQRDKNGEIDIEHPHDKLSEMKTDKILEQYGDQINDAINDELRQVKERDKDISR